MAQHPKYDEQSGDLNLPGGNQPEEFEDEGPKPDWLLSAAHPVEAFQPEDEDSSTSGPVLRRPGAGVVPQPPTGTPRPRIVPNPHIPSPADAERLDGLVGPELPAAAPQPRMGDRAEQMAMHSQGPPVPLPRPPAGPAQTADGSPVPTWAAVTSSIPTLRVDQAAEEPEDVVVAAEEDEWEAPEEETKTVAAPRSTPSARRPVAAPEPSFPIPVPAQLAGPLGAAWRVAEPILRDHGRSLAILAACVVLLFVALNIAKPREKATSVRDIIRDAAALDGKEVRIAGVIGQWFPMGDGYSFYLHQGRDTIVVFTRVRTPAEKQKVKVVGTISTGYLDGQPRPALFETRLD
jgi:hypothetical protein